ncbi:MAG: GNAT family N-acetyltransferase [Clostridia bacterium]|nr:GNAT family N-acetyltransferase [Clostridia bacterium]MBQ4618780.1 GNAT family N-acetyltransferase [Clostridia bacterium]
MRITYDNIILRDYVLSDVEDEVRWTNEETEWFYQEAPWMTLEPVNADELRADMKEIIDDLSENVIRWRFEIEVDGRHIGQLSSSYLNSNYEHTPWECIDQSKNAPWNNSVRALGIEICEMEFWGKGIGTKALTAFMEYYRGFGENRFLLQTWNGNLRMLGCAKKLGFFEVKRTKGAIWVDGKAFDELILEKRF